MGLRGWMDEWMNVVQLLLETPRLETSVLYGFSKKKNLKSGMFSVNYKCFLDTNGIYMVFLI